MAKYPPDKIAEVRERIRLEDWVGRSVQLQKKGRRFVGLCPFHAEKTPSFGVSADKQLFHCFGCNAGGDVFDYVMRLEGLDFPSAVKLLAGAAGVSLPEDRPPDPAEKKRALHLERLYATNAVAQEVFRTALKDSTEAQRYLLEARGLSRDTVERFELGWAPAAWDHLSARLEQGQVSVEVGTELGLLGRRARDGRPYDRLRGRITFPIRTPDHRIVGFGARRADWIDAEGPKYLNSPESPVYDKSRVLYGLHLARDEIRKRRQALLVEGYLDVILLAQAGLTQTVAGCGTALTEAHAKTLARLTDEVITLYDGDLAGRKATHRAATLLLAAGAEVRVVPMPEGKDPDDLVREEGLTALQKRIDAAPSAIDFFLARARSVASGGGVAGTRKAMEAVRPLIEAITEPLTRDVAVDACARELGIDRRTLRRHLAAPPKNSASRSRQTRDLSHSAGGRTLADQPSAPRPHIVETELLKMLLEKPENVLPLVESRGAFEALCSEPVKAAAEAVRDGYRDGRPVEGAEVLEVMRAHGLTHEGWLAEVRSHLIREEEKTHDVEALVERLLTARRQRRVRELRERLERCTDIDEQTRLLEEVRRVQSGEL